MQEPTEHLLNHGILKIGPKPDKREKTIIVLGVGRGGTSLCSKAIQSLGIPTGKDSRPPTFEDLPLSFALEKHDFKSAQGLIDSYNRLFGTWAFKRPTTNDTLSELHRLARNPIYIVIFRDILSISLRNNLSMGAEVFDTMHKTMLEYKKIISFISDNNCSALFVSYEKALGNSNKFIERLVDYINLSNNIPQNKIDAAIKSIIPSPEDYLRGTSAVRFYGYLDLVTKSSVAGWAAFERSDEPVELELFINDRSVAEFTPGRFREDIKSKGLHPTGYCGFSIEFPPHISPKPGDLVSVRFKSNGTDLRKSPRHIHDA